MVVVLCALYSFLMFLKSLQFSLTQTPLGHLSIVALSGGADSVALLLGLLRLGQPLVAAHCNFHLRGEESDADEAFVRQLCEEQGVKLYVEHFDTKDYAKQQRISIEMAARELRYDYFEKLRQTLGATSIAVAHHRDDNVETLLLNLVRGSGLKGLCGMRRQNGYIIRPLLELSRADIENYLHAEGQAFRTDSTNTDTAFKRNKIRHELLPLLRTLNPSVEATLAATMQRLAEAQTIVETSQGTTASDRLPLAELQASATPLTLVFDFLAPYGFSAAQCRQIALACSERVGAIYTSAEYLCVRDRDALIVDKIPVQIENFELPSDAGEVILPNGEKLTLHRMHRAELTDIPKSANVACLDLARIVPPLIVRSPKEGDRFTPYGMKGTQLVSDYLTNRKRNRLEKLSALLLCDAEGPLWLINERPDQRAVITPSTEEVLVISQEVLIRGGKTVCSV